MIATGFSLILLHCSNLGKPFDMVRSGEISRKRENQGSERRNCPNCRQGDSLGGAEAQAITFAKAATTVSMLRLLMAATQMRPESTP